MPGSSEHDGCTLVTRVGFGLVLVSAVNKQAIQTKVGRSFINHDSWEAVFPLVGHDLHV